MVTKFIEADFQPTSKKNTIWSSFQKRFPNGIFQAFNCVQNLGKMTTIQGEVPSGFEPLYEVLQTSA